MAYSTRDLDMQQERIVIEALRRMLFSRLYENAEFVEDLERQLQGIDVIIDDNGWKENVDVKAQASAKYLNTPVPTFVHELLFTDRSKHEQIGWFLKELKTDVYAFVWIHKADVNERFILNSANDIHDMEVMFVDKEPLVEYLNSLGCTPEVLLERARLMRKRGIFRRMPVLEEMDESEMWLTYSPEHKEQPVNLVIKKRTLRKFATKHVRVTAAGIFDVVNDII